MKDEEKKAFSDWLIELANRGFGFSTDAFLKLAKKVPRQRSKNRPFARWRHFTTTTRILFVFLFIFKFGSPSEV